MRKMIFFLLILFSVSVKAQDIYAALQLNQDREYKTKQPKKIVETSILHSPEGNHFDKVFKTFDESGMLLVEERYDKNKTLKVRLTYTNDTTARLKLARVYENWSVFGYSKETAFYQYDSSKFLTGITDQDARGNIVLKTHFVCNDKGHPIELSLSDGKNSSSGKQTATYLYDKNKVITTVISNNGKVLLSDTAKISLKDASLFPDNNEVYNSNGDPVRWIRRNSNGSTTIFEGEYIYDSYGNCTENRAYRIKVKGNGKQKRKMERIYKKEYTY